MFTGIVREVGKIRSLSPLTEGGCSMEIECREVLGLLDVGHSVSVSGVCLTVESKDASSFRIAATPETLRRSTLGGLGPGSQVNLEPALRAADFLGGHLVQGHVDGVGTLVAVREEGNSRIDRFAAPSEVLDHCVEKGSVTVEGISLTVSALDRRGGWFEVALIPHTLAVTNLSAKVGGDSVNLEADVVSKYLESHVRRFLGGGDGAAHEEPGVQRR